MSSKLAIKNQMFWQHFCKYMNSLYGKKAHFLHIAEARLFDGWIQEKLSLY